MSWTTNGFDMGKHRAPWYEGSLGDFIVNAQAWRVWLLEDSALEAGLVTGALSPRCSLALFSDGGALLEQLGTDRGPELLILDCVLPGLSGLEVCRFVRETRDRVELPILMLTANNSEEILLECLEAGANDFVTKPFRAPELLARVQTLSGMSRSAIEARQQEHERASALVKDAEGAAARMQTELLQRDRHIGILGHDLRNPLSAIVMAAQSLERSPDVSGQKARRIQRSAARMALMIKDILDFARGQLTGSVPTLLVPADLGAICRDVVDELSVAHPGREIRLEVLGDVTGRWDPDRLLQAISNLVGNAVEHSESIVTIRVSGSEATVAVAVHNAGPEIPPAELPHLFEAFRKRDQNSSGLGLGLYIVKEIARAHRGTATVESTAIGGTTFTIVIPRALQLP